MDKNGLYFIKCFFLLLSLLVFAACNQPLGLGSTINLEGPVVTITGPVAVAGQTDIAVRDVFELKGTVFSKNRIAILEVTLEVSSGNSTMILEREWKYEGSWQYIADNESSWTGYSSALYENLIENINAPAWQIDGDTVNWTLPVLLEGYRTNLDYIVTVAARDTAGISDSNSTQKLKVSYSNDKPSFNIIRPMLNFNPLLSERNPDVPAEYNDYIYDPIEDPDGTFEFIDRWVKNPIELRWDIGNYKDYTIYNMWYEFTNKHNIDSPSGKQVYYKYSWDDTGVGGNLPKLGIFTDGTEGVGSTVPGGRTKINNAINIGPVPKYSNKPWVPVQIVSRLEDREGNVVYESKGWFPYLQESEKPWVHIDFGYKERPGTVTPVNAPESRYMLQGQQNNNNYAYDAAGVKKIEWKIYKLNETGLNVQSQVKSGEKIFTEKKRKEPWEFTADFNVGRFKIVTVVTNIFDIQNEFSAYFIVESAATPRINNLLSPNTQQTLWGDSIGNFKISGTAEIESLGNTRSPKVDGVSIVWIKPAANDNETLKRIMKYMNREYDNWDKGKTPGVNGYWEDTESRVWEVPSVNIEFNSYTNNQYGKNDNELDEYKFYLDLNLFKDFDVGPGKNNSGTQHFLIRVINKGNVDPGKWLSSVSSYNTIGDLAPPVLTIGTIKIWKYHEQSESYDQEPVVYSVNDVFPVIGTKDKIQIFGTWNDNSYTQWNGIDNAPSPIPNRIQLFSKPDTNKMVTWYGPATKTEINIQGNFYSDGTWNTEEYEFKTPNLDAIVKLSAGLKDHNNNTGTVTKDIIVETSNPILIRISSETSDGIYGENKYTQINNGGEHYIDIYLEFNKPVGFFDTWPNMPLNPGQNAAPSLILNNGGRAYYRDGNGKSRIQFWYRTNSGASTTGLNSSDGRLNVTGIEWGNYTRGKWLSLDGSTAVIFPDSIFDPGESHSLAKNKRIIIDKEPPKIQSIITSAQHERNHGVGSQIYMTLTFNKLVTVPVSADGANFYLDLKGGNLANPSILAKAKYQPSARTGTSFTFLYTVEEGHDTSYEGTSRNLGISSYRNTSSINVVDEANNIFVYNSLSDAIDTNTKAGTLLNNSGGQIVIDTHKPAAPVITGVEAKSYYGDSPVIRIGNLESNTVSVEYCLNYTNNTNDVWITPTAAIQSQSGTYFMQIIPNNPLDINGKYTIAARQKDNATAPNVSSVSTPIGNVIIDKGTILRSIGSTTPDGIYGVGSNINIFVTFRNDVWISGTGTDAAVNLNVLNAAGDNAGRKATLSAVPSYLQKQTPLSFTYTVQPGDNITELNVTGINWGNLAFFDTPNTSDTSKKINDWITIDSANNNHKFNSIKTIEILSSYPTVKKNTSYINGNLTANTDYDIGFYRNEDGYRLDIRFDRDIFRGDTTNLIVFKQLKTDFRIPAVLNTSDWDRIFTGRSDLGAEIRNSSSAVYSAWNVWRTANSADNSDNAAARFWQWAGEQLYYRGSNGIMLTAGAPSNNTSYVPDTSIKYILNYQVNPLVPASGVSTSVSGLAALTVGQVADVLRSAESVSFSALDKDVSIVNDQNGKPRILRINLTADKKLSVAGAKYQWVFPNGFVKDFLEKGNGNGTLITGNDNSLTSGNSESAADDYAVRTLRIPSLVEPAVIRIDKGEDKETFHNTTDTRQALQPLTSQVRIDCRTPGSEIQYRTRQTTDNVGRLIWRADPTTISNANNTATARSNRLPNLGSQIKDDWTTFNAAKNRPQSGESTNGTTDLTTGKYPHGYNMWIPMGNYPDYTNYSNFFDIGVTANQKTDGVNATKGSYNDGGMIIHINAQSRTAGSSWVQSYEAAFRSVFVFNTANTNSMTYNGTRVDVGSSTVENVTSTFTNQALGRIWVRGGNTTDGAPTVPDFPIDRNRANSRKARLLTPIDPASSTITFNNLNNATSAVITHSAIPTAYNNNGRYMWFWVTWKLNVNAYVDIFAADLPSSASNQYQVPQWQKDLYCGFTMAQEHYPVIPGRTTIVETRSNYSNNYADGGHGDPAFGNLVKVPDPID